MDIVCSFLASFSNSGVLNYFVVFGMRLRFPFQCDYCSMIIPPTVALKMVTSD